MYQKHQAFLLIIVMSLFTTSCKRNWVCECKTSNTVVPIEITNTQKEEAKATCEKYNYGLYAQTGGCKLK